MSDVEEDDNSCSTNGECNDYDSNEDEQDDKSFAEDEYGITNLRLYDDEESRNLNSYISRPRQHICKLASDNQSSRNSTSMSSESMPTKTIVTSKTTPTSYVSLIKQTEDELEFISRKSGSSHRAEEGKDKIKAKRRSQNAVTLLFGGSRSISHSQGIVSSTSAAKYEQDGKSKMEIEFPLRNVAAGLTENFVSIQEAQALETSAKKKLKLLKNDLRIAQLDVADAKLTEFAARLQARQVKIHERHANLCKRRAALKRAEEDQGALEAKLDEEEEDHKERERRVKNRERRIKQEEAGLQIKEVALRRREVAVSQAIEKLERRREIVDEKEEVQKQMEEIVEKKAELHGRNARNNNIFESLGRKMKQSKPLRQKNDIADSAISTTLLNRMSVQVASTDRNIRQPATGVPVPNSRRANIISAQKQSDIKAGALSVWL